MCGDDDKGVCAFSQSCDIPPSLAALLAIVCCFAHLVSCLGTGFPVATVVAGLARAPTGFWDNALPEHPVVWLWSGLISAASVV